MRAAVYTDYVYRREGDAVFTERAFALFLAQLSTELELVVIGRLHPTPGRSNYRLPAEVSFVALPYYPALTRPVLAGRAAARSLTRFWRAIRDVEVVWILGPNPLAIAFAMLSVVRRRRLVLGVRQDMLAYVRSRHPGRRGLHGLAHALERAFRLLARFHSVVVVGPDLAHAYRQASAEVLEIAVSLVRERDLMTRAEADARRYDGTLQLISVGRLDAEKNPLLLADVLARARRRDPRWQLVVCGDGPMRGALESRLTELGVAEHAELAGYVPLRDGLLDAYRASHVFLHVSWTEGLPQVLFEAFACRLPVVATAVGGVAAAADGACILIPPGDADAAVDALLRVGSDAALRRRLADAGADRVLERTLDVEAARVARFLEGDRAPSAPAISAGARYQR
jgi:glycosyltransferase involved in cell wall biosynthesis